MKPQKIVVQIISPSAKADKKSCILLDKRRKKDLSTFMCIMEVFGVWATAHQTQNKEDCPGIATRTGKVTDIAYRFCHLLQYNDGYTCDQKGGRDFLPTA